MDTKTLLITRGDVAEVLTMADAIEAVEAAFRAYGEGHVQMPPKVYLGFEKGDLRCMPVYMPELGLAGVKNVNVHPQNEDLPSVMGTLTLFDPNTGFPLAVMDATLLTAMRTGAAGGIAAKYLAREDSRVACFVGAGEQVWTQLEALLISVPGIEQILVFDIDSERAEGFAARFASGHVVKAEACALEEAVSSADIVTTLTPARQPVVMKKHVRPGTHINAIGADAPGKQELDSEILSTATIVIDNWEQASHSGEINVPLSQGVITQADIYADIGELTCGRKAGRRDAREITVFDSTGLAIQDLACAAFVYRQVTSGAGDKSNLRVVDFLGSL